MRVVDCIQGSSEWLAARCGRPTASRFADIVTPTGKAVTGKARRTYMLELLGERLTGRAHDHFTTDAMVRGTMLEPRARAWFELTTGVRVTRIGFAQSDCGRWGASPDGMIDPDAGLEIKCPGRVALLDMIESHALPPDYAAQVQAQMWVCGRTRWHFVAWTDEVGMPCDTWEVAADPVMHAAFAEHVPAFCNDLDAMETRIRAQFELQSWASVNAVTVPAWAR